MNNEGHVIIKLHQNRMTYYDLTSSLVQEFSLLLTKKKKLVSNLFIDFLFAFICIYNM